MKDWGMCWGCPQLLPAGGFTVVSDSTRRMAIHSQNLSLPALNHHPPPPTPTPIPTPLALPKQSRPRPQQPSTTMPGPARDPAAQISTARSAPRPVAPRNPHSTFAATKHCWRKPPWSVIIRMYLAHRISVLCSPTSPAHAAVVCGSAPRRATTHDTHAQTPRPRPRPHAHTPTQATPWCVGAV